MRFEWDPEKAAASLEKHGISFLGAATIFDGRVLTSRSDLEGEERWKATAC